MPCDGFPSCEEYEPDGDLCYECGCTWEFGNCFGSPDDCSTHSNQGDCENCLCDWTEPSINMKINIADTFRDAEIIYINIANVWREGAEMWVNIGDTWRRIF